MRATVTLCLVAPLAWVGVACREKAAAPEPTASASAAASAAQTAPSVSAASAAAPSWFAGAWRGQYKAELFRIAAAPGGVKDWAQDDGKKASGDGQLALAVAPDGTVQGTSSGALGDLSVSGRFEDDHASLSLAAATADGFHGMALLTRSGEHLDGSLNASSGDSLQVRTAKLTLERSKP